MGRALSCGAIYQSRENLSEELKKIEGPIEEGCIRFIESFLILDPAKRPGAEEALKYPWLQPASSS